MKKQGPNKRQNFTCSICSSVFTLGRKPNLNHIIRCGTCKYKQARKRANTSKYWQKPEYRERNRMYRLRREYNLSPEQFEALHKQQKGLCAVCQTWEPLVVDHDHQTGHIRELLCNSCNMLLGKIRDSVGLLDKFKQYLLKHGK